MIHTSMRVTCDNCGHSETFTARGDVSTDRRWTRWGNVQDLTLRKPIPNDVMTCSTRCAEEWLRANVDFTYMQTVTANLPNGEVVVLNREADKPKRRWWGKRP